MFNTLIITIFKAFILLYYKESLTDNTDKENVLIFIDKYVVHKKFPSVDLNGHNAAEVAQYLVTIIKTIAKEYGL